MLRAKSRVQCFYEHHGAIAFNQGGSRTRARQPAPIQGMRFGSRKSGQPENGNKSMISRTIDLPPLAFVRLASFPCPPFFSFSSADKTSENKRRGKKNKTQSERVIFTFSNVRGQQTWSSFIFVINVPPANFLFRFSFSSLHCGRPAILAHRGSHFVFPNFDPEKKEAGKREPEEGAAGDYDI